MVQRPEYPTTTPSVQTWEEACVISQEWADGARQAVIARRKRNRIIRAVAFLMVELALIGFLLYVILQ